MIIFLQGRIAVEFRRGGLHELGSYPLGQAQHIDRPVHRGLGGLHRIELVMDGRGRTGQVINLVHLHIERKCDVVAQELKPGTLHQVVDILLVPGKAVFHANDFMPLSEQPLAEMGARKTGSGPASQ